ncbi:hypothetical protein D9M69_670320 [compost metagenome]
MSLRTVSAGVPAGTTRPHQVSISKPGRVEATVGTSGTTLLRWAVVTARALSLPERMLAAAVARLSKLKSTWPESRPSCAGLPPL